MTNVYFEQLNQVLKNHYRALPSLLIDLDILDKNIATLKSDLNPNAAFRIVVKSLPCVELIEYTMKHTDTNNLMVFHQPFLTDLTTRLDAQADILIGKPMPIKTTNFFYKNLPPTKTFDAFRQIQWLVDSEERMQEYINLAKSLGKKLRLNLEIDVGLHRGGFINQEEFSAGLRLLEKNKTHVSLSGLMGYDAHVTKLPSIVRSQNKALRLANQFYETCKKTIQQDFPELWNDNLTFNGAGSPTINLHKKDSPLNDISAGSCLVKPTSFDIPTLENYQPASFIATPVLKSFLGTTLPAIEKMKGALNLLSSSNQQSFFIYGGFWKADYYYPKGVKENGLFGSSTNQTMINAPKSVQLNVDDFVFLRPHQSEFVFLQFGNILALRNGVITNEWSLLKNF